MNNKPKSRGPRGPYGKNNGRPREAGGYTGEPIRKRPFELPPNCRVVELRSLDRRLRSPIDREGMGMTVLTDDYGRPVVKDVPCIRAGEVCFVLR